MSSNFIPRQIVNGDQLFYNLPHREKSNDKDYKCKNTFVIEYCNGRDIIEW